MERITRSEIRARLKKKIANKEIIVGAGAGSALTAKILDENNCDLIFVYSTGKSRMDGTLGAFGNIFANNCDSLSDECILPLRRVVLNTPIIVGFGAGDPYRRTEDMLDHFYEMGYSGFINVPTAGAFTVKAEIDLKASSFFPTYIDSVGCGVREEARIISQCDKKDYFSLGYAYTDDAIRLFVSSGCDVIIPHLGKTIGGSEGATADEADCDEMYDKLQRMTLIAKQENPDIIVLGHGGILTSPREVAQAMSLTDAHGFIGASSCERIPIEIGMAECMSELRSLKRNA